MFIKVGYSTFLGWNGYQIDIPLFYGLVDHFVLEIDIRMIDEPFRKRTKFILECLVRIWEIEAEVDNIMVGLLGVIDMDIDLVVDIR